MVTKELLEFVKAQMAQGATRADLEGKLLAQGWQPQDLAEAFASFVAPVPAPMPASAAVLQGQAMASAAPTIAANGVFSAQQPSIQNASAEMNEGLYAGFWRRFVAVAIDGVVMQLALLILGAIVFFTAGDSFSSLVPYTQFAATIIGALYVILMNASAKQATLGKMAVGIKVTTLAGERISFLRSLGRYFSTWISALIFGIGFLMAGFTARKQALHDIMAGTLVVRYRESSVGKIIALCVAALIALSVAGMFATAYLFKGIIEDFKGDFEGLNISIDEASSGVSDLSAGADALTPQPLTEAQYGAYLSQRIEGVVSKYKGPYVYAGPARVSKNTSSLDIVLPPIPNIAGDSGASYVDIDRIYDSSGKDINDTDSSFNTDIFFKDLDASYSTFPVPHLAAERSLYLIDGAKDEDIRVVEGKVVLALPIGIETKSVDASSVGKSFVVGGNSITVNRIEGDTIDFSLAGSKEVIRSVVGYGTEGTQIKSAGYSSNGDDHSYSFDGDIVKIDFFIAKSMVLKSYPFTLDVSGSQKTVTPADTATAGSVSSTERDAVIAGFLKTKEVFSSADASKIRSYILKIMTDPADREEVEAMSDGDLLEQAGYAAMMYEEVTESLLRSPSTTITITGDEASIQFSSADGSKTTLSARKVGGVWY